MKNIYMDNTDSNEPTSIENGRWGHEESIQQFSGSDSSIGGGSNRVFTGTGALRTVPYILIGTAVRTTVEELPTNHFVAILYRTDERPLCMLLLPFSVLPYV